MPQLNTSLRRFKDFRSGKDGANSEDTRRGFLPTRKKQKLSHDFEDTSSDTGTPSPRRLRPMKTRRNLQLSLTV